MPLFGGGNIDDELGAVELLRGVEFKLIEFEIARDGGEEYWGGGIASLDFKVVGASFFSDLVE